MSFRSMIAFGESNSCNTDAICFFRWSIPSDDVCTTATSSYRSTINPDSRSASEFTTRKDVAPDRCRRRCFKAAEIRRTKNARSNSSRSWLSNRTRIRDLELKNPTPRNRCRWSLTCTASPSFGVRVSRRIDPS